MSQDSVRWTKRSNDLWYGYYEHLEYGLKLEMWASEGQLRVLVQQDGSVELDKTFEYPGEDIEYSITQGQATFMSFAQANKLIEG